MSVKSVEMIATGELILGMPDAPSYFTHVAPALKAADLVVGQLEVPHTNRPCPTREVAIPAPNVDELRGISYAGFHVVTLAGNPIYAYGAPGIEDTMTWLKEHNIASVGAGMNITEARRPVILERNGTRFGFLSFNCVGPAESAASATKPGSAYVDIITHYEKVGFAPGASPQVYTYAEPWSLKAMMEDISSLRSQCDVLAVAIHKGLNFVRATLADYEFEVCHAAVEAGADLIMGSHSHVLKGIEFYKGKPVFHCLNNLVTVHPGAEHRMFRPAPPTPLTKSRMRGSPKPIFQLDPEYPCYPFPPDSRKTIIAKFRIENGRIERISYLPCIVNKKGQPEILKNDDKGQEVFNYISDVTKEEGLNSKYRWDGDEVVVSE